MIILLRDVIRAGLWPCLGISSGDGVEQAGARSGTEPLSSRQVESNKALSRADARAIWDFAGTRCDPLGCGVGRTAACPFLRLSLILVTHASHAACYRLTRVPQQNSHTEALTPNVTRFGDGTYKEVIKGK